jgi:predicted Zn-dependent protease
MMMAGILMSEPKRKNETFSQLAEKAKKASEENRLEQAARFYRMALAMRPRWAEGWWSLGTLEYDQNLYAQAADAFTRLVALQPTNGTAHAMFGLCQFELDKDEAALKNLLAAEQLGIVKDERLRHVVLYHMGLLQLRAGKFSSAKETLDQLARDGIRTQELRTALGLAALLVRPQAAPPAGTAGEGIVERAGQAEALLAAKDFERAKQVYIDLLNEYPDYPNLHLAFGRLLLDTHETDRGIAEFQRELKRDPKNVNSLLEIAAVRYRVDSAEGMKYAQEAVKLDPQRPFGHYLLGLLYLDTRNYAGAISELEIAKRAHPDLPEIYFALGNASARAGRKQEAAAARASFARLNAQRSKELTATVYGEQPSGLMEKRLESPASPPAPQ